MPAPFPRSTSRIAAALMATVVLLVACTGDRASPPARRSTPGSVQAAKLTLRFAPAPFTLRAPIQREVAVESDGTIYIAGGLDAAGASVAGVFALDPATGELASLGSVPQPFHDAAATVIGDRLVIFGGGAGRSSDLVQSFALGASAGGGHVIGHLPKPLSDLAAAAIGGTVYIVGGFDGVSPQREVYATTDGVRFRSVGRLPIGLRYAAVAPAGGRLVIAGGESASGPVADVSSFDPTTGRVSSIGRLAEPVGHASAFGLAGEVIVAGGQDANGHAVRSVERIDLAAGSVTPARPMSRPISDAAATSGDGTGWLVGGWRGDAVAQVLEATLVTVSSSATTTRAAHDADVRPFAGMLVVADRGNNRLLVIDPVGRVVWRYPSPNLPPPPHRFYFPDDAFWVHDGHAILVNEEDNEVLTEIAYPSGRVLWTFGHPGAIGSAPGYLDQPDDVYPTSTGGLVVADARNCRILFFDAAGHPDGQIGRTGVCRHGLPATVGYPNGDTPLPNGDLLLSELNGGRVDEVTAAGDPVWSLKVPGVPVPSDPQRLTDGSFLVVDYERPGRIVRFTSAGRVLWSYGPAGGLGMLDHPSLAVALPNGLIAVNDDYRHRVLLIDQSTDRIVWQYGATDVPGVGPNRLRLPDGLDLLLPGGVIPLHVDFPSTAVLAGRP